MRVRSTSSRPTAGFTLIEIIVSVGIMGFMLMAITKTLQSVRDTRDLIHNIQETQLGGPVILDLIERDLRAIYTTNLPAEFHLRVENRVQLGEDADRIDFITTTDGMIPDLTVVCADVNEVGYCLRPSPLNDDFRELYRREDFGIDEEPHLGGNYIFLHDKVVSFNVEVYTEDGEDAEPLEEWGVNASDPDTTGLPARLVITIVIEIEPRLLYETQAYMRIPQKRVFQRIIRLPQSLRLEPNQLLRFAVPTAPSGAGTNEEELEGGDGSEGGDGATGGGTGGSGGGGRGNTGGGRGAGDIEGEVRDDG